MQNNLGLGVIMGGRVLTLDQLTTTVLDLIPELKMREKIKSVKLPPSKCRKLGNLLLQIEHNAERDVHPRASNR